MPAISSGSRVEPSRLCVRRVRISAPGGTAISAHLSTASLLSTRDDLVGQRHHRAAREHPHHGAIQHHDGRRGVAPRRRLEGADHRAPVDAKLVERQRHAERARRALHLGDVGSGRRATRRWSRAPPSPVRPPPARRRGAAGAADRCGSRATSCASSASASSCRPFADSTIARSLARSSRSGSRRSAARSTASAPTTSPRALRRSTRASTLPPHATSADSSRASCSSARRSCARRRSASTHRARGVVEVLPSAAPFAGRRLDRALGVEVESARREGARQQQLRRPPGGRGARGRAGGLDRVARAFVLEREVGADRARGARGRDRR